MSHKHQTRLVIPYCGELKRIISTRERSDGGINITTHLHRLFSTSEADPKLITESRFSVQVSSRDANGNNTVHGTTKYGDGTKFDTHLSTSAIREGKCQLITTRSVVHLRELATLAVPAKPSVVELPTYDPDRCTMCYQVWFCSPGVGTDPELINGPYSYVFRRYQRFTLFIPYCYFPTPSEYFGTTIDCITTTLEKRSEE